MSDNKLLLPDTTASVFQPRLAAWIGINEAILLQHVHYLAGKEDFGAIVDGIKWIRMTTEEWAEELPCFDERTIRRALENLEGDGLLVSRTFSGRSKWYRVNYEALQGVEGPVERLQSRSKARAKASTKAAEARHNTSGQNDHIGDVSGQNGQLQLVKMTGLSGQNDQLPRPLPRPLSDTLLPNGNSGLQPPEEPISEKWNNANKKIVGDKFFELTHLRKPTNKKTVGAWWGWLFEIFELANKDPTETCKIMTTVVKDMQRKHLTISSPKSLHWGARALVSGQELNDKERNNGNGHALIGQNQRASRESGSGKRATGRDLEQQPTFNPYTGETIMPDGTVMPGV